MKYYTITYRFKNQGKKHRVILRAKGTFDARWRLRSDFEDWDADKLKIISIEECG